MSLHRLRVNGREERVDVDPSVPLVWVLRDVLNLTGTKFGCGKGLCRACTVHVNGVPTPSCLLPIGKLEGEVTTIESLVKIEGRTVARAWEAEQVPQCGFCQPGQIMSATALLRRIAKPSDDEIDRAMRPHLCRCGTYSRIRKAIHRAADMRATDLRDPAATPAQTTAPQTPAAGKKGPPDGGQQ